MNKLRYQQYKLREQIYIWLSGALPKRLVLWCFIMVSCADGSCPDPMYSNCYDYWAKKYKLTDMA